MNNKMKLDKTRGEESDKLTVDLHILGTWGGREGRKKNQNFMAVNLVYLSIDPEKKKNKSRAARKITNLKKHQER